MGEGGEKRGPKGPKKDELDAKTPMDGSPPIQDLSEITGQHEAPEGRWRGERGAKKKPKAPPKPPPAARPPSPAFPDLNDTNPRFAVPDEITDAGIVLGETDVVDSARAAAPSPVAPAPAAPAAPVLKDFAADERFAPRELRAPKDDLGPPLPEPAPAPAPAPAPTRHSDRAPPRVRAPMPSEAFPPDPFNTKGMFGVDSMAPLPPLPMFRPELATAGDDLLGTGFEDGGDNEAFERHLARYIEDFDDDENRIALELMADKLGRWSEIVVEAKRHLARLTGTTGEDRIWAHLSLWNERARGDREGPPTSRSGEMQLAPPGPDLFGAEYTSFSGTPTFDPPPLGEALFQWPPPAPMTDAHLEEIEAEPESADPSAEEISEVSEVSEVSIVSEAAPRSVGIDAEPADSEPEPESIELVPDSSTGNLAVKSDTEPPMTDAQPPPTEAGASMHFPPQSARTMFGGFTPSDRAEDSRTIFMPNAPVPPATDSELPLDADDLIEELDENDVEDDAAARRSRSNEVADRRQSAVSLKNDPGVAERRAERESRLAQLRAEQEARAKERRGASAGPPPAPPVASAKATTTPTPLPIAPKPTGIDPTVLKTGEFDAALEKAVTDEERARILLERGRRDQKKGRTESAINSFRDVLTFEPNSLEAMEALAQLYREVGNTARLVETLEQKLDLAKTDPQRVEVLVALADVYETVLDDVPEAIARLERAHALAPRQTIPLQALARCHEKAGKYAAALEDLRKLLKGETSRSEKLELLLQIAGLQENKLDDPEGAVRTFEQIVAEHPQYKGAFDDLARLAEKSGSWRARAKLVEHQVELAKEPKRQAQLLVELGDLLAHADRDPEAAKKHYERAAKVFPSYPASWRGLEQLSAWAGDQKRAEFYLEQRVRHTSDLGERARVLIELAQYRGVVLNKQVEAIAAFEAAHKADPTNETAALALLGPFVGQKRFAEAAVLCDVLYRAALKADDRPRMLEILETSWQVATSMGNRGQLLAVAAARFRLAPDNARFREAFLDTAYGARENEEALKRIRSALDLALERTGDDLETLSVLGELFRGAGDLTTAESCFERVLLGNPVDPRALAFLSQRAEDRNDFRRAAALKERLARETRDNEKRFDLLLCAGDLWLRAKQQVGAALRAYEEALEIKPKDQLLLRTLHGLYVDQEQWDRAAPVQRALADLEVDAERKGKLLTSLAQMLEEQLDDVTAAADVLEEVLETDASRLDAFERLVRILTRQKDWIGLANGYRQMIGKLDEKKDPKLAFALNHQLGLVYRDRVGDAERALKAFTHAASLRPDDLEARKIVTELLVVTQRLDAAVDVARATLKKDPLDQQLYRDLYELFLRAHAYDKAWCVAEAMSVHGPLTDTERQFVEDYPPVSPGEIPASLLATAWPTHIHHADLDRTLSSALQIAVAVYLRARLQQAAPPPLGIPLEQDASPESARVLAAFRNAAEVLACTMPALHGTPVPGPLFTTVLAHHPTITISLATSSTVADDLLNYLATKRLAEQQPALRARSLFPSVQELKQLFFTTTQLATTGPGNMMRPGWDGGLGAVMTPDERAALRGLVAGVASSGQKLDVKRWLQLAEVTAMRAGLLICGSVLTAQRAMGLEPRMPDDLGAQAWLAELGLYATSEQYFELRETIHVAI